MTCRRVERLPVAGTVMYLPIGMTFDIEKLIRTDPIFRAKLEKSVKNVIATSAALHKKK